MNDDDSYVEAVCEALKGVQFPPVLPAKLLQGDRVLSTGRATLPTSDARGWFSPDDKISQDIPDHGISLKLSDRPDAIPVSDFLYCTAPTTTYHYHFRLA